MTVSAVSAPAKPLLPDPPDTWRADPNVALYLRQLVGALSLELSKRISVTQANHEILLTSPRGNIYSVQVSDAGVVTTTLMYQP